jgi:hypothetical protein
MATLNAVDRQAQILRLILAILGALLAVVGWARFAGAQPAAPKPAVPLEPVAAIVDAPGTHGVVEAALRVVAPHLAHLTYLAATG